MKGFPFVIGTDIVQISRFHPLNKICRLQRLARRILHPLEFSYLETRLPSSYELLLARAPKPAPSSAPSLINKASSAQESQSAQLLLDSLELLKLRSWLAGRWAAKEAARKAWGAEIIGYKDVRVEVSKSLSSSSSASVSMVCEPFEDMPKQADNSTKVSRSEDFAMACNPPECQEGALSISHDGDYVVATVIAEPLRPELREVFMKRSGEARSACASPPP